ncbi:hypothetical protein CROQUDRAFT_658759 [Cronartium quercuum f. sp. fusiforme G11]|uniref:Uncharacterized protein n=1 Tax=Cronartium quercuum f. sp. fusiforme G11 TaxID=708437 RepID=A0A9P6NJS4_9BASI|nr:hypothetical protein CROQUDRAFT_658759 [Cronartium quercuum f. sp. fusiforme G11]
MIPLRPILSQNASFDSSSGGSTSSGCRTFPSSKLHSAKDVKGIARNALRSYAQIPSIGPETPSVESIIAAYELDGHGDRALLVAILEAKKMEDERLAARDKLELEKLWAHNRRWLTPGMATGQLVNVEAVVSAPVFTNAPRVQSHMVCRRKLSVSSESSTSSVPSPRPVKRARDHVELPLTAQKVTRETVKMALEGKIARSKQARLDQRPTTPFVSLPQRTVLNYARPTLKLATDQINRRSDEPNVGKTWVPRNPRPSSRRTSVSTQACSVSSLEARSTSPSPPFSTSSEPAMPACTEDSAVNSRLRSSLARLLNDPDTSVPRVGS